MTRRRHDGPAILLEGVRLGYGRITALAETDLTVASGTALALVGANGSGKSTLLKAIAGLLRPIQGRLTVYGLPPRRNPAGTIAYVPQLELVDWQFPATVRDVVAMGRFPYVPFYRAFHRVDHDRVDAAIEALALTSLRNRRIADLSGGQQQRMFLARAIAQEPEMLLLDEPTTGVDAETEEMLRRVVRDTVAQGTTMVMSTHDLEGLDAWCESVAVLDRRVLAVGSVADIAATSYRFAPVHGHTHV